jgi:hypothetical protein
VMGQVLMHSSYYSHLPFFSSRSFSCWFYAAAQRKTRVSAWGRGRISALLMRHITTSESGATIRTRLSTLCHANEWRRNAQHLWLEQSAKSWTSHDLVAKSVDFERYRVVAKI